MQDQGKQPESTRLWLDLSQLNHLDSAGVAVLLEALRQQRRSSPMSERLRRLLARLGLA